MLKTEFECKYVKFRLLVCLLSYTLPLTLTPDGLDYSGLSTSHTRIAWAYLGNANNLTGPLFKIWKPNNFKSGQMAAILSKIPLKSEQKYPDFEWFGFQIIGTITIAIA